MPHPNASDENRANATAFFAGSAPAIRVTEDPSLRSAPSTASETCDFGPTT